MKLPEAQKLASALAQTSMSEEQKRKILKYLPYLSATKINRLYLALINYHKLEKQYLAKIERLDLKYKTQIESFT